MRLPRDLSGHELIKLLRRYGYEVNRQVGSHIRLRSDFRGYAHHLTSRHIKAYARNPQRNSF